MGGVSTFPFEGSKHTAIPGVNNTRLAQGGVWTHLPYLGWQAHPFWEDASEQPLLAWRSGERALVMSA